MDRLLIIDGHAYAYRAFHAIRGLRSPDGRPTNAIYGFVKMLAKMRAAIGPSHLMVVWDGGLSAEDVYKRQPSIKAWKAWVRKVLDLPVPAAAAAAAAAVVAAVVAAAVKTETPAAPR